MTVLGLDIGGSKTHALLVGHGHNTHGGSVLAEHVVASANLASVGAGAAAAALAELATRLGIVPDAVCAGAAGADSPTACARLAALLADRLPGSRVEVAHDTRIILAAAALDVGTVLVRGTGSVAWGRRADGAQTRAGGWGYLLGDEGGGYAAARDAARRALAEVDHGQPPGPLTKRLLRAVGVDDPWQPLDRFYQRPARRYWAALAREVLAGDDPASREILEDAARALTELARTVTTRPRLDGPVVLAGGLAVHQPSLSSRVAEPLGAAGLPDVRVLDRAPTWGAVRLATTLECS